MSDQNLDFTVSVVRDDLRAVLAERQREAQRLQQTLANLRLGGGGGAGAGVGVGGGSAPSGGSGGGATVAMISASANRNSGFASAPNLRQAIPHSVSMDALGGLGVSQGPGYTGRTRVPTPVMRDRRSAAYMEEMAGLPEDQVIPYSSWTRQHRNRGNYGPTMSMGDALRTVYQSQIENRIERGSVTATDVNYRQYLDGFDTSGGGRPLGRGEWRLQQLERQQDDQAQRRQELLDRAQERVVARQNRIYASDGEFDQFFPATRTGRGMTQRIREAAREFDDVENSDTGLTNREARGLKSIRGYAGRFAKGALFTLAEGAQEAASIQVQDTMAGRSNPMNQHAVAGSMIGGLVGAGIGSFFPGYGTLVGAGVGSQLGSTVARMVDANKAVETQIATSLIPISSMSANLFGQSMTQFPAGSYRPPGGGGYTSERPWLNPASTNARELAKTAKSRADYIQWAFWGEGDGKGGFRADGADQYAMTAQELAETYESSYQSLVSAGIDPEQRTMYRPGQVKRGRGDQGVINQGMGSMGRSLIPTAAGQAILGIGLTLPNNQIIRGEEEPLYQYLAEHADILYGKAGKEIFQKELSPIISSINQTGGNWADILMRFGPQATTHWGEVSTPLESPQPFNLRQAMEAWRNVQVGQRSEQFASTLARGYAAHAESSITNQMMAVEGMPGGRNSLTWAQMNTRRRAASIGAFNESNIVDYDIPMTALRGQAAIMDVAPFSPGNRMSIAMQSMGLLGNQANAIQKQMGLLRGNGDLSEQQELAMTQQIWGLRTERASLAASLVDNVPNRIPAMSANAPSFSARLDGRLMTAMQFGMIGHPFSGAGALGNSQREMQQGWLKTYLGDEDLGPTSRTQMMNNGAMNGPNMDETNALLRQILSRMEGSAPGGSRGLGGTGDAQSQRRQGGLNGW